MDYPVTVEDWENMLVTFKEEYGATMGFNMAYMNSSGGLASGFDALAFTSASYRVVDGEVVIAQMQPEWKEMMECMQKWWEMGLIDKDSLTLDDNGVRNKAINELIGVTVGPMSMGTNLRLDAEAEGTGADWVGMEYARVAEGVPTSCITTSSSKANSFVTVVTKGCSEEEMIAALKFLNYGFTEEGKLFWNYGQEGYSYELDANGVPQWTAMITEDAEGANAASKKYAFRGMGPTIQLSQLVRSQNNPVIADAVDLWSSNTVASTYFMPGGVSLTDEEFEVFKEKWGGIATYISEESMKFFTGDRSLEEFDDFCAQLETLGANEVLEVWQAGYDRYMGK